MSAEQRPAVSVLVRSMDRDSLPRALSSLQDQGLAAVEVLVLNATGRAHRRLPALAPSIDLRLLEPGRALGRVQAANALLELAGAEHLLFLDDDDELLPGHLARLLQALQQSPQAAAAYADVEYGEWVEGHWQVRHRFEAPFDRWRLLIENYLPIHAVLFRSRFGLRFDESLDVFEDWDYWLQLADRGDFIHMPGLGARYVAGGAESSGVFELQPHAVQARTQLQAKWLARLGAAQAGPFLAYVQGLYRERAQRQAERDLAQEGHAATRRVLQAREAEIADLRALLAAREQEIRNALAELDSLRAVRAARETEIAALHAHSDALQTELNQLKALTPWQSFQAARRRTQDS